MKSKDIICGVYKIQSPSGRVYIGSSNNIKRRFAEYKRKLANGQSKLNKSFLKYGIDNHDFKVLIECGESELFEWEHHYSNYYDSIQKGLNCKIPGFKEIKGLVSICTKEKMSKAAIGRKWSEEEKASFSKIKKGVKPLSAIKASAIARTGKPKNRISVNKTADALRGISRPQYVKDKISEKLKGVGVMGSNPNAKIVLNIKTGIYYDCCKEAANTHNISYGAIKYRINAKKGDFIYA